MHNKAIVSSDTKVLIPSQSSNIKSSIITEMICRRCPQSRRITNRLTQLEQRNRRRMLRLREYKRLRDSVPSIAHRPVDKLTVITEATRLISELEAAVLHKFNIDGVPDSASKLETLKQYFFEQNYFKKAARILRSVDTESDECKDFDQIACDG